MTKLEQIEKGRVIQQWNKPSVYTKTVAYFASKLAGSTVAEN